MHLTRKARLALVALACATTSMPSVAQQAAVAGDEPLGVHAWREDLEYMVSVLESRHANLYHTVSEERFRLETRELGQRLGTLADHEIIVELARLTALIGDGHTGIPLVSSSIGFHAAPLRFRIYPDGVYLVAARPIYSDLVGGRLTRIGGFPIEDVIARVLPTVFGDSHLNRTRHPLLEIYLATSEVLHAAGVTTTPDAIPYRLVTPGGEERTLIVPARPLGEVADVALTFRESADYENVVSTRDQGPDRPLWLRRQSETYWFQYLEESRSVYIQVNEMSNFAEEPMATVFARALDTAERVDAERFIIDLRANDGGDHIHLPIVHDIIARSGINRRGRLFVLIGPLTFSAAETFAVDLETHTNALFVGEPTGGRPNHYGSGGAIFLPNSGIRVRFARTFFQNAEPDDDRPYLAPEVFAPMTFVAEAAGRDPALEWALAWEEEPALAELLPAAHQRDGLDGVRGAVAAFLARPENSFRPVAPAITSLARELMDEDRPNESIEVSRLATEVAPRSTDAWVGLARALEEVDRIRDAVEAYQRLLHIDPGHRTAGDALQRLGHARASP